MESGSRRKQLRPARVEEDDQSPTVATVTPATVSAVEMNTTNGTRTPAVDDAAQPVFENNVKSEVDEETGIEMMSGETRGPYPVKELRASSSEAENAITLMDQMGNQHYFDVDSIDPIVKRIKPCPNALEANCIVFHVESLIQILITRDVKCGEDLVAIFLPQQQPSTASEDTEKRYPCPKCHIAKFNNIDNLTAHQKFYCKGNQRVLIAPPAATFVPSIHRQGAVPPPNVILVPIAYHDHQHEMVQLLGPPQTIVPVAIGRPTAAPNGMPQIAVPLTDPLLVQRGLCGAVQPPPQLKFAVGDLTVTIPVVPIEMGGLAGLKRTVERPVSTPLDLSKRRREDSGSSGATTPSNTVRTSHSDVEKPFLCSCGVSFSADETLKAHKQYYCKMVERSDDNKDPPKKVTIKTRCSQCDYEPGSLSQLSVHVRTVHNEVQAYVCRLCGYRGFSLRGIRSHMRSHSELDAMKFEFLLANHISKVKTERKSPDNQENMDQD
ncbi:hypothetical protein ANCCAN_08104 [Ancylostoma caninum]|uniref:C2H2-type domain-containing protein n=1 Tax=Ancylostoma caninum TaxID=29170 RepID=A0A368GRP1_ANCCA|nr:hypothetical protein ANCCAN_08104 [Ancylostoma caninum]